MPHYSDKRKTAVLKQLLLFINRSVPVVIKEASISEQSLYNWHKQLRNRRLLLPSNELNIEQWSAEARFVIVIETATFSEAELSEYCKKKGLYSQQETRLYFRYRRRLSAQQARKK